jgi:hypothetical protein
MIVSLLARKRPGSVEHSIDVGRRRRAIEQAALINAQRLEILDDPVEKFAVELPDRRQQLGRGFADELHERGEIRARTRTQRAQGRDGLFEDG